MTRLERYTSNRYRYRSRSRSSPTSRRPARHSPVTSRRRSCMRCPALRIAGCLVGRLSRYRLGRARAAGSGHDVGRIAHRAPASDRYADPTPFRHSFSFNSINLSKYVTQYNMSGRNLQNRLQTARSTMAPISRGGQPTLDDAPKKIAVSRTVSRSSRHIAILSWRSRTPPTIGETGLLISVDRPRWSGARE